MKPSTSICLLTLLTTLVAVTGCSSIDRVGGKMDMAVNHVSEEGKYTHEGHLVSRAKMGVMTTIQLDTGEIFDVVDVSPGLVPGDTIRIYETEKGLVARLWRGAPKIQISENLQPRSGS